MLYLGFVGDHYTNTIPYANQSNSEQPISNKERTDCCGCANAKTKVRFPAFNLSDSSIALLSEESGYFAVLFILSFEIDLCGVFSNRYLVRDFAASSIIFDMGVDGLFLQ